MGTNKNRMKNLRIALFVMPLVILTMLIGEVSYVKYFNSQEHVLSGAEDSRQGGGYQLLAQAWLRLIWGDGGSAGADNGCQFRQSIRL